MSEKSIGSYKVLKRIGEGGMAKVYLAVHQDVPNLKVVLKILDDPRLVERFRSEADKLALLDGHGHICQIKHFFNHGEDIVIAMEYIDGQPLDELIKNKGQLPLAESLRIISDVLDTLEFAHQRGISHRDIKPSNVMIDGKSQVKIIDFGIAKAESDPNLTVAGSACGTPTYMAPEQFNPADGTDYALADIYAVGTMLYFLLTGKLPFAGDNAFALRDAKLFTDPPPPRDLNPDVPGSVQEIVLKALQKNPEDRFASALQMKEAIATHLGESGPARKKTAAKTERVRPTGKKRRGKTIPVMAAAAVVVVIIIIVYGMRGGTEPPGIPGLYAPRPGMEITTPRATFSWEATAGTGGAYTLEYAADEQFSDVQSVGELTATSFTTAESLPAGQYYWRVQATDKEGTVSGFTEPSMFSISLTESVIPRGNIEVTVAPRGDIYVDDSLYGENRQQMTIPADTGLRIVRAFKTGSRQREIIDTVRVVSGETVTSSFRFTFPQAKPPAPKPAKGDVRIGSNVGSVPVFGALVYIDGTLQRNRTPNTFTMPAGRHIVRLVLEHNGVELEKTDSVFVDTNGSHKLIFEFNE